jgi:hypothetical protein
MKNPLEKNDHKVLIAGIIIGSVIAGAAAYLFLTETGTTVCRELTGHLNRVRDAIMGGEPEQAEATPVNYYLHHDKPKPPKTDKDVLKHAIVPGSHEHGDQAENS